MHTNDKTTVDVAIATTKMKNGREQENDKRLSIMQDRIRPGLEG
jgi:hypothetical protein